MSTLVEGDLCRIFSEMLAGIKHMHDKRLVHRDIKPDNFLFGGEEGSTVKLCDFGLAAALPSRVGRKMKGVFGTAPYMSPEMLGTFGYDGKTDVWSFGATVFLMIHGDYPYVPQEANAALMKKCIISNRPEIRFVRPSEEATYFSRAFVDRATPFLQALLQRTPGTRKSAEEALAMPFLADIPSSIYSSEAITGESEEPVLALVFRKARTATLNQKEMTKQQPIKQKALEDILEMLQQKHGDDDGHSFFSEGDENIEEALQKKEQEAEDKAEERIAKRTSARFFTHSGTLGSASSDTLGSNDDSVTSGGKARKKGHMTVVKSLPDRIPAKSAKSSRVSPSLSAKHA